MGSVVLGCKDDWTVTPGFHVTWHSPARCGRKNGDRSVQERLTYIMNPSTWNFSGRMTAGPSTDTSWGPDSRQLAVRLDQATVMSNQGLLTSRSVYCACCPLSVMAGRRLTSTRRSGHLGGKKGGLIKRAKIEAVLGVTAYAAASSAEAGFADCRRRSYRRRPLGYFAQLSEPRLSSRARGIEDMDMDLLVRKSDDDQRCHAAMPERDVVFGVSLQAMRA